MKLKEKVKTYNFWVSLASAVFLILKVFGEKYGFNIDEALYNDLITSLCSILVILGIIVTPTNKVAQTDFSAQTKYIAENNQNVLKTHVKMQNVNCNNTSNLNNLATQNIAKNETLNCVSNEIIEQQMKENNQMQNFSRVETQPCQVEQKCTQDENLNETSENIAEVVVENNENANFVTLPFGENSNNVAESFNNNIEAVQTLNNQTEVMQEPENQNEVVYNQNNNF